MSYDDSAACGMVVGGSHCEPPLIRLWLSPVGVVVEGRIAPIRCDTECPD